MSAPLPEIGVPEQLPETVIVPPDDAGGPDRAAARYRWSAFGVFLVFLCVHLFIFRGVLIHLPDLLSGRSVLNTSELVPFFDPSAQFFEQAGGAFSDLTNAYEFRVRYSLLTTWMRYYLILPFSIVLVPFLGAFFVCLLVSQFLHRLLPSIAPKRILYATALTTLFIHLILLSAKITHFYTLILGFDIFVISFVLFLQGILLETKHPVLLLLSSSIVALVNPTVHFLVLYPLTVVFFCSGTAILLLITGGKREHATVSNAAQVVRNASLKLWKRLMLAVTFMGLFTIVPYGLFVRYYVLRDVGSLTDVVPDTVASIRANSLSLFHQIAFDISSVTENFLSGFYISPTPHYAKIFYFLIALIPFIVPASRNPQEMRRLRPFLILIGILMAFSMWCSIGYAKIVLFPTFHMMLAALYRQLYLSPTPAAVMGMKLITEVIHVLRYPDRFQFIFLAAVTLLMPIGVLILERDCPMRLFPRWLLSRTTGTVVCTAIFFLPLFAHWEYRTMLLTGDFGGFLHPYNVQPLREIKDALQTLPPGKVVVLPPSEGPWIGETKENVPYKFIDKFFIYFLNKPSYYFGLTGSPESKYWFYLMFESLNQNEHWWVNIFRNLNIHYLVLNKELTFTNESAWYMQRITQSISLQPRMMPDYFKMIKENDSFALFEFISPAQTNTPPLLMDTGWNSFRCVQERSLTLSQNRRLLALNSAALLSAHAPLDVMSEDRDKTQLDIYAKEHPDAFFRPDQSSFAFMENHIPSSQFFNTVFSMLNLPTASQFNIFNIIMPGPYDTLTTSFVGIIKPTTIRFPLTNQKSGTYEIFLRSVPTRHNLAMRIDRGPMTSITTVPESSSTSYIVSESSPFGMRAPADISRISPDVLGTMIPRTIMPMSDQFEYISLGTTDLTEGRHVLFLHKNDANPLIIEGVLLFPVQKQTNEVPLQTTVRLLSPDALNK
ncbi:MAG: hypothetical protein PHX93_02720 [Candidatus Peribacteraceae bacterium]|jgi:hypothetical protein|nr:hypothetical protein [Candidatus Peribacteraceae bacterium]